MNMNLETRQETLSAFDLLTQCPSVVMGQVVDLVVRAGGATSVLVTGETGTGKELIAQAIHQKSGRKGNYLPVNCGAIPEQLVESELFGHEQGSFTGANRSRGGWFEYTNDGTLFFDELEGLPLSQQARLLRAMGSGEILRVGSNQPIKINCALVFATNQPPEELLKLGKLREDLYHRINVLEIAVPSLRERPSDIAHLARHFARTLPQGPRDVDEMVIGELQDRPWKGNIRELRNAIERAMLMMNPGEPVILPKHLRNKSPRKVKETHVSEGSDILHVLGELFDGKTFWEAVQLTERAVIERALRKHGDNILQASEALKVSHQTVRSKKKGFR